MSYDEWLSQLRMIANPVLLALRTRSLKTVYVPQVAHDYNKKPTSPYIEIFCRTILGVAPLFNSQPEAASDIIDNALHAINVAFDGYLDWECDTQLLVEASFLSAAFVRAPPLWTSIEPATKSRILAMLKRAATIKPCNNNWILMRCYIEVFLYRQGLFGNLALTLKALQEFETWYVGDSWYKDGPEFAMDYYNSYIILPYLYDIYTLLKPMNAVYKTKQTTALNRMRRHAEWLERCIGPDGTFPLFGRSMVYRTAAFHALAYTITLEEPTTALPYSAVRSALSAVHAKMFVPQNFEEHGFLQLGFMGPQRELADRYINNGSCYLTLLSFMPLGLVPTHRFWTEPSSKWTQQRAYDGESIVRNSAFHA